MERTLISQFQGTSYSVNVVVKQIVLTQLHQQLKYFSGDGAVFSFLQKMRRLH